MPKSDAFGKVSIVKVGRRDSNLNARATANTVDGPVRSRHEDAEADRKVVAGAMDQVSRPSGMDAASNAIAVLRDDKASLSAEVPGSASSPPRFDPEILQDMKMQQLRSLASRIPDMMGN